MIGALLFAFGMLVVLIGTQFVPESWGELEVGEGEDA